MAAQRANLLRTSCLVAACTFAASLFVAGEPTPAQAQFGFFRQFFGGGGGRHRSHHARHHHAPTGGNTDEDQDSSSSAPSEADSTRELAKLAPPAREQMALLKNVNASDSLGAVGSSDDQNGSGNTASNDADRDYTTMVDQLIQTLKSRLGDSDREGDVTETAVMDALTEAILQAKLERFETFIGENWSAERLRGMIVKRVTDELGGLFEGNNRGAVSMADLNMMIKKAAREVYSRLFETSELLASNRSATLFVQRLYQARGDLVKGDVREDTEELLLKASSDGVSHFQDAFNRADHPYTLIYRAQRIIFDCLSQSVESITESGAGMASTAEIEKRLIDTDQKQCTKWVSSQMIGADGGLKKQEPMPLRVIWTSGGPQEDPSMYGHASDQS
ncbi:hypothetical protein [uncultured Methylovirgula sp.]|uniref:hypothetical protein n=1 Tax=uncultured Methylovirgula sp. TaxID=1285960 RepID=UPI00261C1984|nr:hypothetical protein [uncultured Methylovirgula sp.]